MGNYIRWIWQRLDKPVPALPLDLFRIGVGLLSAIYFWQIYRDVNTISSPNGLIDHKLVRKMFPFTRLSLFPLHLSNRFLRIINLVAIVASFCVTIGCGIRRSTLFLYGAAVSTYRRNFITMHVDDGIMHLLLFWLLLLPTGHTLTINKQKRQPWQTATVPGFTTRAFLANLSLIYLVAGLWKWSSRLWTQGFALYTVLKMPISYAPRFWSPRLQPLLTPLSYAALILEPLLAMLPLLPIGSRLKYGLGGSLIAFHVGIISTLRVPLANIACIAALPLHFGSELISWLAPSAKPDPPTVAQTPIVPKVVATALLSLLTLANIWRIKERIPVSGTRPPLREEARRYSNPWHALLWIVGLAQSYRLMDWIDDRNWHIYYEGVERIGDEAILFDPERLFPSTTRNVFLHSYINDQSWRIPPTKYLVELQRSLLNRYVRQFAHGNANTGTITIYTVTARITPENVDLSEARRFKLLEFSVKDGTPTIHFMHLSDLD